jgi:hypothetical protein
MKRILLLLLVLISFVSSFAQIKISNMTTFTGVADSAWVPVIVGGANRKVLGKDLSRGDVDSITVSGDSLYYYKYNGTRYYAGVVGASSSSITASNLGGGLANYSTKVGNDLRFNSFNASDFDLTANQIVIDYANTQKASSTLPGALSSTDWNTFNNKLNSLDSIFSTNGILVRTGADTYSTITDNSTNWNAAYNDKIVSVGVAGTTTKTLTLTQQDGGTVTTTFTDETGTLDPEAIPGLTTYIRNAISGGTAIIYNDYTGVIAIDSALVVSWLTGSTGLLNTNIGSGYRLLKPAAQEIKTLYGSYGLDIDSTTNTDGLTFTIDSTKWATQDDLASFSPATPDLQAVTDEGNTTTNSISALSFEGASFHDLTNKVLLYAAGGTDGRLQLANPSDYGSTLRVQAASTGASLYLPWTGNATDTLATLHDVRAAGGGGGSLTNGNGTTANGTAVDLGGSLTGYFQIGDYTSSSSALSYQPFIWGDFGTGYSQINMGSHVNDGGAPATRAHSEAEYYSDMTTSGSEYTYAEFTSFLGGAGSGLNDLATFLIEVNNVSGNAETKFSFKQQNTFTGNGLITMSLPMSKDLISPPSNIYLPISVNGTFADASGNITVSTGGGSPATLQDVITEGATYSGTANISYTTTGSYDITKGDPAGQYAYLSFSSNNSAYLGTSHAVNGDYSSINVFNSTTSGQGGLVDLVTGSSTVDHQLKIFENYMEFRSNAGSGTLYIRLINLPVYADEAAAAAASLAQNTIYKTSTGELRIKL